MADLSLRKVKKVYDNSVVAVQDFNLEIADKEFIVLVGPSGCGKSTTLRMVAGLEAITDGEIYIGGRLVNNVPPKDRDIAMVFQNYALYPHMTVYDNIAYGLKLRKLPSGSSTRRSVRRRRSWTSRSCWPGSPRPSPADSASGWPSAGPSSAIPRYS